MDQPLIKVIPISKKLFWKVFMIRKLGQSSGSKKGRWATVFIWIAVLLILNIAFPQANSQKTETAGELKSSSPSQQANKIAGKEFPSDKGTPALLTFHHKSGLDMEDIGAIQGFAQTMTENPASSQDSIPPLHQMPPQALMGMISKDGTTLIVPVSFKEKITPEELEKGIGDIEERIKDTFSENPLKTKMSEDDKLLVRITGPAGIALDANKLFGQGDLKLLFGTVAIVLTLLLLIYRSPILALVPLVGVGIAYGIISPLLGWIGKNGWAEFDSQGLSIMTVLLFGAGTDYCLFLISSYRHKLEKVEDKFAAMKQAIHNSSGAIAMSGLTVVFSLLALLLAKYGSIHRFAIPFSLSIFIMMAASLTLVPALLSILGRGSFYPFVPRTEEMKKERAQKKGKPYKQKERKESFGLKLGGMIGRHPWLIIIATAIFLGAFALFSTKIQYTYDTLSSFPKDMPSREGFTLISDHYSPGDLAPVHVIADTEGNQENIKQALEKLPYVASVTGPEEGVKNQNIRRYEVKMAINPYSNEAMDHIPDIKAKAGEELKKAGIGDSEGKVWIGGMTSEQFDTRKITTKDSEIIMPVILAMIAILLLVYLRSITATAYLIGTVVLSYFSALGLGWVVLHYGFGVDAIQGFIPLYAFVFIVALGEDYNIFMVSGIWKKCREMPLRQAVKEGVAESGAVITSAGLILAGTFTVLTTLPIQILVHFGTITAIGILLDTFIVRPFLVPAITVVLGKWAFWPAKSNIEAVAGQKEQQTGI